MSLSAQSTNHHRQSRRPLSDQSGGSADSASLNKLQ
jgi:hypothetical protein